LSSIVVAGDTSGSVTLSAPAVANTTVLTLPSVSGTVLTSATGQTLTAPIINGMGSSVITSGTAVASTSGTSIDFTGIPSWAKRITIMFNGVSTNGTSIVQVQLGNTTIVTTGYLTTSQNMYSTNVYQTQNITTGFGLNATGATNTYAGQLVFTNFSGNTWVGVGAFANTSGAASVYMQGSLALAGTLDRVRITTINGTDTFDAGSINILWE